MPKVICKLPNASELINGVRFVSHKDGMVSEEISEEAAERFASISGYEITTAHEKQRRGSGKAGAGQPESSPPASGAAAGPASPGELTGGADPGAGAAGSTPETPAAPPASAPDAK